MFCKNCGKKLEDGAAFCPECGAAVASQTGDMLQNALNTPSPVPVRPAASEYAPAGGGKAPELEPKPRKSWILPTAIGGVAVACILAAALLSGIFSGAKGNLTKAVAKSVNAWQAAADSLELPDLAALRESREVGQRATIQLKNISDEFGVEAKALEGMSVTMAGGSDLPGRKLNFSLGASYGPAELFSAQIWGEDSVLTLSCPALFGEKIYGANTETLGQDLARLVPHRAEDMKNISFNVFDIMEAYANSMEVDAAAAKALTDAIEVEKAGTAKADIEGMPARSEWYRVTVPQKAMLDYLNAVRSAYDAQARNEAMLDIMRSFGASEWELDAMEEQLRDADAFEDLKEFLEEAGDLKLDVYVNDGYVSGVRWEGEGESLAARFGGGANYADDFWMDVRTADGHFSLTSSGNHSAAGGAFTDTSSLIVESGYTVLHIESQLTYDPKQPSDNFSWTLSSDGVSLEAKGQLTSGTDNLFMDLDQLSVRALGVEYARLGMSWMVGPYDYSESAQGPSMMLSDITADDLESLHYDVVMNFQNWALNLMKEAPELFRLFM